MKNGVMLCPECESQIFKEDTVFFLAVEKPYLNVYFHRSCFSPKTIGYYEYITEHIDKLVEFNRLQENSHFVSNIT